MKNLFYLIVFILIINCSSNKSVYWCGDHACINKKEKEAYFKKTMIVEVKDLKKGNKKNNSEIEKILQQAKIKEKKMIKQERDLAKQVKLDEKRRIKEERDLAKQVKLDEKRRIKEERDLAKQVKLDEKRRIKEERDLAKQVKLDEKRRIKEERDLAKRSKIDEKTKIEEEKKTSRRNVNIGSGLGNIEIDSSKFYELVEKIKRKNIFRPYPNINDIPN